MNESHANERFLLQRYKNFLKQRRESALGVADAKTGDWLYTDSHPRTMEASFKRVLPEGEQSLRDYLIHILEHRMKEGGAVGIEFGGPGRRFFFDIGKKLFKKTAGVSLMRSDKTRVDEAQIHDDLSHEIIIGDMLDPHTYDKVRTWLEGDKVDVIVERLLSGFDLNPEESYLVAMTFDRWYKMLAEEGVMFVQVPWWAHSAVEKWVDRVRALYGDTRGSGISPVLEVQYCPAKGEDKKDESTSPGQEAVLRLRKLKGAPQKLPPLVP